MTSIDSSSLEGIEIGVQAEWHDPKLVLMHRPGIEVLIEAAHRQSSLYEASVDLDCAREQHDDYRKKLQEYGMEVLTIRDALGNLDTERLLDLAEKHLFYTGEARHHCKRENLQHYSKNDLIRLVLLNLTIDWNGKMIAPNVPKPSLKAIRPASNLMYTRDPMITTDKGVVMTRMRTEHRMLEPDIVGAALNGLGIKPIYELADGILEGGDFFPMGDFCLISLGQRTNKDAAKKLMENGALGYDLVILVDNNHHSSQDEMHMDTYFNVLYDKAVALLDDKIQGDRAPKSEIWYKQGTGYKQDRSKPLLSGFLGDEGFKVFRVSKQEQLMYLLNFLNIGKGRLAGIAENALDRENLVDQFQERLRRFCTDNEIRHEYVPISFDAVNAMYGGHRCSTQVLSRQAPSAK